MLVLWIAPGFARAAEGFGEPLAASVFTTALAFVAPRTLDIESIPQLTIWGLHGLTAIDPALTIELRERDVRLNLSGKTVFTAPVPKDPTAEAWGTLAAQISAAADEQSDLVHRSGTGGVIQSFFDELFNHLDPYSRYTPPGAATTDRERRSGEAGLGLTVMRQGSQIVVRDVATDGPADDAGLEPGDRIVSVDGRVLRSTDVAAVAALLAGPEDSTVKLTWRSRDGRMHTAAIARGLVPPQTVMAERLGDLLVIRITGFSVDTDQQFSDALDAGFEGHRVRGIILDLRGNRGGLLRQAVTSVDAVTTGGIVATTAGRHPDSNHTFAGGTGEDQAHGRPIVVLVDGRTASAAEIMAAALEDSGRAVVVGSVTLGKGLVQTITPLPDGGELFVTWSRVLAPLGWPLQGLGIMPQICTSLGEDSLKGQLADLLQGKLTMADALARHNAARAPLPVAQVVEMRNACPAAEGRDEDVEAAKFLIDHPLAYAAALTSTGSAAATP
jgi:carboxyl-terminal processing protease